MKAFYERPGVLSLFCTDVMAGLGAMESAVVQACITSPPYWGLRDYGLPPTAWPAVSFAPMPGLAEVTVPAWKGCLGLEHEPFGFVAHLVHVFRAVRRVLAEDGTVWLNLGDTYAGPAGGAQGKNSAFMSREVCSSGARTRPRSSVAGGVKSKDMLGIPWRVAFALQADGWWLRSDVIWAKPNPMPESVTDRPTKAHEYVFIFAKSERYLYAADAIRQPLATKTLTTFGITRKSKGTDALGKVASHNWSRDVPVRAPRLGEDGTPAGANARTVWTIASQPYTGAHFATMPAALAERCMLAGSRQGDVVLDPFNGAGTTGLVALRNGRRFVGVELNPTYCALALERWRREFSLFLPEQGAA
jgi:DNA modification methylase